MALNLSKLYNHLNICISRPISYRQVTYGETITKGLLLKLKVVQVM